MDNGNETPLIPSYGLEMNKTWATPSTYNLHKTLPPPFAKLYIVLFPFYPSNWKPYGLRSLEQGDFKSSIFHIILRCIQPTERKLWKTPLQELWVGCRCYTQPSLSLLISMWFIYTTYIINHAATSRFLMNRTALEFALPEWIVCFLLIFKHIST